MKKIFIYVFLLLSNCETKTIKHEQKKENPKNETTNQPKKEAVRIDKTKPHFLICTGRFAKAYHKKVCEGLEMCRGEIDTINQTQIGKYKPCRICFD